MAGNQAVVSEGLTTRQKLAVMQAFCSGKQIEIRSSRKGLFEIEDKQFKLLDWVTWTKQDEPKWNWDLIEYRVKE